MAKPTLLVLAAGMGRRYGGLKQLDKLGPSGEAIIDYSIYDAIRAGFGKIVFVIRKDFEKEIVALYSPRLSGRVRVEFVRQELDMVPDGISVPTDRKKPWGTAHAVLVADRVIDEPFGVINADDFYGAQSYQILADFLMGEGSDRSDECCIIGYELGKTLSDFGAVSRGVCEVNSNGYLNNIVERTHIERKSGGIVSTDANGTQNGLTGEEPVSMNMWGFQPSIFGFLREHFARFVDEKADNVKAELYIPVVVNSLIKSEEARVRMLRSPENWFGVTYREDKADAVTRISRLVGEGRYPENLWS